MRGPLEVVTSKGYWTRMKWLLGGGIVFCLMFGTNQLLSGNFMVLVPAAMILAGPLILIFARRWWVQRFDEQGVTLRNGRTFLWRDFERVEKRKYRRRMNNYDLVFKTGRAGVYFLMAENSGEVLAVIRDLQQGCNPFVGSSPVPR